MNVVAPLVSSLMLTAALPNEIVPMGVALLGPIALVPVLAAVYRIERWRSAARMGALFGAVSTALSNYWLAFFGEFSVWTIGGTILGYAAYNYILFGYIFHLSRSPRFRAVRIATVWAGYEYLKSVGFLAYPWGLIAYPAAASPHLAQIAELTGVWGLAWLMAYVNSSVAELLVVDRGEVRRAVRTDVAAAVALFLVTGAFGVVRLNGVIPIRRTVDVLLVQQNVDSWAPGEFEVALRRAQRLTSGGIERNTRPDLIAWSETTLRRPYLGNSEYYGAHPEEEPFTDFLRSIDVPLVTGTPVRVTGTPDYMNGAVMIAPDGTTSTPYGKRQLVPFAESIPFYEHERVQRFFREVIGVYGSWVPGARTVLFDLDGGDVRFGTPICFEDAFGYVVREMANDGADLFVNLTNNSWSRQYSAQTQHYAAARLRSIETRRPLVRGTNSGLTAVVDHRGFLQSAAPMFESTVLFDTVAIPEHVTTLYMRIGDLFGRLFAVISIILTALFAIRRRRADR